MPTQITTPTGLTAIPGVYGSPQFDDPGLGPQAKILCIVADIPELEAATPAVVYTRAQALNLAPDRQKWRRIVDIAYRPSIDRELSGGPGAVVVVSPRTVTQATTTLLDSASGDSIVVTAREFGLEGRKVKVTMEENASDATLTDVTITKLGSRRPPEVFSAVGSGAVLTVTYGGTDADTMTLAVVDDTGTRYVRVQGTIAAAALGAIDLSDVPMDGALSFTPSVGAGVTETYTVTVVGIDKATGLAATDTLTWDNADGTTLKTTSTEFTGAVTVTAATDDASTPTFLVAFTAFDLSEDEHADVDAVRAVIASASAFTATVDNPQAAYLSLDELDELSATDCTDADGASARADVWAWIETVGQSAIVEVERASGATLPPDAPASGSPSDTMLTGGTESALSSALWSAALDATRTTRTISHLWIESTDADIRLLAYQHADYMEGQGRGERQVFSGLATGTTKSAMVAAINLANRYGVAAPMAQEIQITDPDTGRSVWLSPEWQALQVAAMACATPVVGKPLGRKRARVLDVRNSSTWDADSDADELLKASAGFYSPADGAGFWMLRPLSAWRTNNDVVRTELSAVESWMAFMRFVRAGLEVFIQRDDAEVTEGDVRSKTLALAEEAANPNRADLVRGFDGSGLTVTQSGDTWVVDGLTCYPKVPINFINLRPSVRAFTTPLAIAA